MKIHIKRSFDASFDTYDSSCDIQRIVAEHLASKLSHGYKNILEIGAGTGVYTEKLAERYSDTDVTCIDISHQLLLGARDKVSHYKYVCADGEHPPFKGCFDLITSSSTLQWFINPENSIPGILSLLKPDGEFAFSMFAEGTFTEMSILNRMTGFGSVYDLRPDSDYLDIFEDCDVSFETKEYVLFFHSVEEFLKKQKGTGATFTGARAFTSKSSYRKFLELYPELFGEDGKIPVTYKIFYIHGKV